MAANTEIERVKERIDIVELINSHVPVKKAGRSYKACCPFHQEKTPSFVVYPDTQSFYCFGCGQSGDAFTFLMKIEGLEFPDALERLAARAGVELTERQGGRPPLDAHRQRLYDATATAAAFFHHLLLQARAGEPGRQLLAERGINAASVEVFGLGFAPDSWETLRSHLREREIAEAVAVEAGLLSEPEPGRVYDRFRGRLIFPIRDREGRVLGFGGRALAGGQPKYLNSAQSPIFDKSTILYGIDVAAAAIKQADTAVIVEGYVDALMAHQCGHANVVATMGTALTEAQAALLKPLTRRLVLALDADAAGRMATLRGVETLREALADETAVPVIGPGGLMGFQRRLSAEIRIMTLPAGEDPDSLLRKDPAAWPALVEQAQPLVDFVLADALAKADLSGPAGKRAVLGAVAPLLRELGDAVAQAHYVGQLGRRLALDEHTVRDALIEVRRRDRQDLRSARDEVRTEAAAARAALPAEDYLLGLLLRYPAEAAAFVDRIAVDDFTDTRNRLLWEALRARLPSDGATATANLGTLAEPALAERVASLAARLQAQTELPPARAREEIVETLKRVRRRRDERARDYWQTLLREVEAGGEGPDRETIVGNLAALMSADRYQANYPRPSPYFRDIRDPVA